MSRQHHYIKIRPEYYRAIERGEKTFEVRYNDRNYKKYDVLHLQEWLNGDYTGREITADVTYILNNPDYCKEGYVVMAIKVVCIKN
jgi:ASC-1-like (ASCH) protein